MKDFIAISPSPLLALYVREYWFLSTDSMQQGRQRAIPSGYTGLVLNRGGNIYSDEYGLHSKAYLFGQSVRPVNMHFYNLNLIIIIFRPLAIKVLLNIPCCELKGKSIELNLLSSQFKELENRLSDFCNEREIINLTESFLLKNLQKREDYNYKRIASTIELIKRGENNISQLADKACIGYKQFKRLFSEYVGLNPKEFIQIQRFSKTIHQLQTNTSTNLNEIACECGYYDKSHLIREVKSLSGYTPNEFRLSADPYSEYRSLFQSFFINTYT